MKEPCRTCPEKQKDYGGCRCQAYLLTGDMANTDPVCSLSPEHHRIAQAIADASDISTRPLIFRNPKNSMSLSPDCG
jgi:pyrroloquinoline quinone biosynthesis protein E